MRIVKETGYLMELKDRKIFVFLFGIIIILAGFIAIFYPLNKRPSLGISIGGILVGCFIISIAKISSVTLNKNTNKLLFVWRSLFSRKIREYNLDQIKSVELQQFYETKGYSNRIIFILKNGEEVPLNALEGVTRVMGKQITNNKTIGPRIALFLEIEFKERRPPTLTETFSKIQDTVQREIEKYKKE